MPDNTVVTHNKLTANQVAWWAQTQWQGNDAITATAIALAESGGDTGAYNDNPATGDLSYGLWQVNMIGALGTKRRAEFGISSNGDLFNPQTNAKAAKSIFDQVGFSAWSTYKNGAYRAFLIIATQAAAHPENGLGIGGKVGTVTDPAPDVLLPLKQLFTWLSQQLGPFFLRIAGFVGGAGLIIFGVILYVKKST